MPLLADVTFSTEGVVVITGLLGALVFAIGVVFRLLMKSKDDQLALAMKQADDRLKDEQSQKKSYKEIAEEAVSMAENRINRKLEQAGHGPTKTLAGVVPEHSSPVTKAQQETAELQTLRARITAATLAEGLPAREPGIPEGVKPEEVAPGTVAKLKADIAEMKQDQLRTDIADVKDDTKAIREKVAEAPKDSPSKEQS